MRKGTRSWGSRAGAGSRAVNRAPRPCRGATCFEVCHPSAQTQGRACSSTGAPFPAEVTGLGRDSATTCPVRVLWSHHPVKLLFVEPLRSPPQWAPLWGGSPWRPGVSGPPAGSSELTAGGGWTGQDGRAQRTGHNTQGPTGAVGAERPSEGSSLPGLQQTRCPCPSAFCKGASP